MNERKYILNRFLLVGVLLMKQNPENCHVIAYEPTDVTTRSESRRSE
jgi:hypothetical protein